MRVLWILLGLLLFLLPLASAVKTFDVTLKPGESFLIDGKNITLLASVNGSTMLCVNNDQFIVSKDKRIKDVYFDFRKADYEKASFKIQFECEDDCQCDLDECNNNVCPFGIEELEESVELEETNESDKNSNASDEENFYECSDDEDCDDNEACTLDLCSNTLCRYENVVGCSDISFGDGVVRDDKTFEYLAFSLLALALILGVLTIFKLSFKKKKR